ncbi:Murein DD-endopeptidase MepM and murein hydrolase activator NlpD, contain LysM domain [Hyphomicrobiales bacterium]|nr:Murein DD-endopeptidase MepM and murein hydrolase activator NlpD, contain LysM domain [Hyphomicrobiales bacterium]CAH1701224.1 Murein DD-endopeptidase MepM and murein hydrolase activator NlpD, contain LysM domain [Hyphomicrobiales bacterium]CAI0345188.1 lipoprotein NlpD [Hyphomicrobiales bacterium]
MRSQAGSINHRALRRLSTVCLLAIGVSACSSDAMRFTQTPFDNPFKSAQAPAGGYEPTTTGSIGRSASAPLQPVPSSPVVRAQPLPPPQSAVALSAAPAQAVAGSAAGWSAQGGTPIVLAQGESLDMISSRYGVPRAAIMSANGLSNSSVTPGTRIVIPVYNAGGASASAAPASPAAPAPKVAQAPAPSQRFVAGPAPAAARQPAPAPVVDAKAQAKSAAEARATAAVEAKAKAEADAQAMRESRARFAAEAKAKADARKTVPATPATKPVVEAKPAAAQPQPVKTVAPAPQPAKPAPAAKPVVVASAPAAEPKPTAIPKAEPAPEPKTTASLPKQEEEAASSADKADFRWPARGRVISGYSKGGNEGINIAVPEGTPVKAAEGGTVAYAGSELKGYGNLVLIRHPNGYVSAYAHNGDLKVKRGDVVKRGQVVANSGQSGNVSSPQLHFELRKGSTPVDPTPYLNN